ncbi:M28 family peptidase [Aureibaculum sp. 2210JD6-5]|uniref:M28 family peptidase n=1 Tax=Aureibaculum sp. 2210JD6-5 TaxID=3103957 RepID=UPI002AAD6D9D|nr:M28 family peptidase [Aureibaculum sp. 2210JD6-5]MDY7395818.1 M28 family peptidase [Aureibaculum sp. 2210JD6-5]
MNRIIILAFFALLFFGKTTAQRETQIYKDVVFLSDDKLEGRGTGTDGEKTATEYIAKRFKEIGLEPKGNSGYFQDFTFTPKTHPHGQVNFSDTTSNNTITGRNVLGYNNNNAKRTIIIGAHHDHLGYGDEGSLYRGQEKLIHNGADDNASGVAVLLNLAEKLAKANTGNNYLFITFSGEEMGLLGSNYFVKNATINLDSVNYMLNMDMVGRLKEDNALAVYGVGTSPIFKHIVNAYNDDFKLIIKESGVGPSDHTSFYLNNIPVLHFFTGQHEDYHRPGDDSDKLNYKGMETISNYIFDIITDLDDNGKLPFRKTKNESEEAPRFKVTLGVVPDYMFDGKGMRIDGVSEDKPAQKAGLQKGDVVVQLGDNPIDDMMGYMKALSTFKAGETTTVKVDRNGKIVEKNVTF